MKKVYFRNQPNWPRHAKNPNPSSRHVHQQRTPYAPEHQPKQQKPNPLLPVTVIEELRHRVNELEIQVAVANTMLKLEMIRRQNLIDDLLRTTRLSRLEDLKSMYRPKQKYQSN